jgi:hypothetical protein
VFKSLSMVLKGSAKVWSIEMPIFGLNMFVLLHK